MFKTSTKQVQEDLGQCSNTACCEQPRDFLYRRAKQLRDEAYRIEKLADSMPTLGSEESQAFYEAQRH